MRDDPQAQWASLGKYAHKPRPALYLPPLPRRLDAFRTAGCVIVLVSAAIGAWTLGWFGLAIYRALAQGG